MSSINLRQTGWLPNYHGGWAMISLPPLLGLCHSGFVPAHILLLVSWFAAYFLFFALVGFLRHNYATRYRPAIITYGILTTLTGSILLLMRPLLIAWFIPLFLLSIFTGEGMFVSIM